MNQKTIAMGGVIFSIVVIIGVVLLLLWTLPVRNEVEGDTVKVHFVLGNVLTINTAGASFAPVPDIAGEHLIRTNGTSLGKIHSGHFKNTKTGDKFLFYITGKGTKVYFEAEGRKYVVDFPDEIAVSLLGAE